MKIGVKSRLKFTLLFVIIGLLPMVLVSLIATYSGTQDIKQKVYNQLTAINQIKKQAILDYFKERKSDLIVLRDTANTLSSQAFAKLANTQDLKKAQIQDYLKANNAQLHFLASQQSVKNHLIEINQAFDNPIRWGELLDQHDKDYNNLLALFGWYDFFLINLEGDIIYSVIRESDLGQNLSKDLTQSSFNFAFNAAKSGPDDQIQFADYLAYKPSNDAPAAFGIKPVTLEGERIGYIAYQQPIEKINEILGHRIGMGRSGESYLVGQDHLMRSDSFSTPEKYSIESSFANQNKVQTKAVIEGLSKHRGTGIIMGKKNQPVLSHWDYIELDKDHHWALISEINVDEALNPTTSRGKDYYENYIEHYGYYDLFLIQPDGHIFYSVKKDDAYQTNIFNGPFANTNLAQAIRETAKTGHYAFVDFAAYIPSDTPAAFIAQPIKDSKGATMLYIALEMPTEGITNIMDNRKGMGETGESILVGEDFKMRSNSYLDPIKHSIKASLSGTVEENGIDNLIIRKALEGISGAELIVDYHGHTVLASYDRISFENFNWAIVSEIDEEEAFASIYEYTYLIFAIMLLSALLLALIGFIVGRD